MSARKAEITIPLDTPEALYGFILGARGALDILRLYTDHPQKQHLWREPLGDLVTAITKADCSIIELIQTARLAGREKGYTGL